MTKILQKIVSSNSRIMPVLSLMPIFPKMLKYFLKNDPSVEASAPTQYIFKFMGLAFLPG
jgi:hypothetical protein